MTDVEELCLRLRADFERKNAAREECLAKSREVVRYSANATRHTHRNDRDGARQLVGQARDTVVEMRAKADGYGDVYFSGYVQDAQKEYVEAACFLALLCEEPLPEPEALAVEYPAYLNGLGEVIGELRRHILDRIREGEVLDAERWLRTADDLFYGLTLFDFPEPMTGGLRRTVDAMRGILERTRGEVTLALRQLRLEDALLRHAGDPGKASDPGMRNG